MTSGELRVRLFAGLREEAGWQERSLVHQSGMTAAAVWKLLNLGGTAPPATVRPRWHRSPRHGASGDQP